MSAENRESIILSLIRNDKNDANSGEGPQKVLNAITILKNQNGMIIRLLMTLFRYDYCHKYLFTDMAQYFFLPFP
jgi:hypothetical protein